MRSQHISSDVMGIRAALIWTGVQFLLWTVPLTAYVVYLVRRDSVLGVQVLHAQLMLLGLSMVVLALVFCRYVRREGLTYTDLGYRADVRMVAIGLAAGVFLIPFVEAADRFDHFLFPWSRGFDAFIVRQLREGGVLTAGLLITINGLAAPVVEEFAWRGYIQRHLPRVRGLTITALLFAAKHVVTDLSIARLTVLLVGSFGLGYIRYRWNTTSSTAAHIFLNTLGSLWSITDAWRGA